MTAKEVIDAKRRGLALGSEDIRTFVDGFTRGEIPDAQMSALAMAICCRGMDGRETADLTAAMTASGRSLEWGGRPTADKHSTGGVGDKLTLITHPLAASCGVVVPSLVGRGLGLTGGTADKLSSVPGYDISPSLEKFRDIALGTGLSIATQTEEIAPADRKLYALRDVTGTVASIPLITASILSKKLAEGAGALVFDVKFGSGAFMDTVEDARNLANALVSGARSAGRRASALITRMDEPLGRAVGNANEVSEAIAILRGDASFPAETALSAELAAEMVSLALGMPREEALSRCLESLASGAAYAKFEALVKAHGGDIGRFEEHAKKPVARFRIQSPKSGYVSRVDAAVVASVALRLGAGRQKAGDRIDMLAGVTLDAVRGDRVSPGAPLATISASRGMDELEDCAAQLLRAFSFSREKPEMPDLVVERVL